MATDERVNNNWFISLSPKEAVDTIGLLAVQLADTPLIGNQDGACPDIDIVNATGKVTTKLTFTIDTKSRSTGETTSLGRNVIILSRQDAFNIIGLLAAQLAGVTSTNCVRGACPNFAVQDQDQGHTLYHITLSVNQAS